MNEIFQLKEKAEEKKRLEEQLKKTLQEYNKTKEKLSGFTYQLSKESNDVSKLEEGGVTALFYSILGNKAHYHTPKSGLSPASGQAFY